MLHKLGSDLTTQARKITTTTVRSPSGESVAVSTLYIGGTTEETAEYVFILQEDRTSVLKARDLKTGEYSNHGR